MCFHAELAIEKSFQQPIVMLERTIDYLKHFEAFRGFGRLNRTVKNALLLVFSRFRPLSDTPRLCLQGLDYKCIFNCTDGMR